MDTPLNKAHFYARKSLHYSGNEKSKYINLAIDNFKLALNQTSNAKAIDSIQLQISYYEKQLKLQSLRTALRQKTEKQKITEDCDVSNLTINEHVEKTTDIQLDLLKNLEESYKLIEELSSVDNADIPSQISQLQNLNLELNVMFHKLSISVEEIVRENELLRDKIDETSKTATTCNKQDEFTKNEIIEQRDSDNSSPEEIHELPPLELPTFNLDALDK